MTEPKTISKKPIWFDSMKYQNKFKLTHLHWYWELMIRRSYLDQIERGMEIGKPLNELREKKFATLGANPIIPDLQLRSILKKDIWSERGYKSHSARLSTCLDIFNLEIREDIREDCGAPNNVDSQLCDTPIDLQDSYIDSIRLAHLTINLDAPNSVLKEDIWKIVEALKKDYGSNAEIITSKKRNWEESNVLEHIDLYLAEIQQGAKFKPSERLKWIPPKSDSYDQSKASTREREEALKLLDDQALHQIYIEIYSADKKSELDRRA